MKYLSLIFLLFFVLLISAKAQSASVISENANLRGTPKQSGKVVTSLPLGSTVEILKQSGSWFLVQSEDYAGWMHGNTIKLDADETVYSTPAPLKKSSSVVYPSETRTYLKGPRGGCYYYNSRGNKTYVDRSLCN